MCVHVCVYVCVCMCAVNNKIQISQTEKTFRLCPVEETAVKNSIIIVLYCHIVHLSLGLQSQQ